MSWLSSGRTPGYRPSGPTPATLSNCIDVRVDNVDKAEEAVLALGARRLPNEHESGFRVYSDPVGHPFCLVFG